MPSLSPAKTESVTIPVSALDEIHATILGVTPVTQEVKTRVAQAQTAQPSVAPEAPTETLDYQALATEHAELIKQGKTSLEIVAWLSQKLGFTWAQSDHHGEFRTCSTPQGNLIHLKAFLKHLGVSWSNTNGGSDNHPEFFLSQGYFWNAVLGAENMKKADVRNDQVDRDWKAMGDDYAAKEKYLKEKIGLDIKGNWQKLTGFRWVDGRFDGSDALYASGALDGRNVRRLWLDRRDSVVRSLNASIARLCFLA